MKIAPVSNNAYNTNFNGLKFQNGVKTKSVLSQTINDFIKTNKSEIDGLKSVDLLFTDNNAVKLCVKNPRYLAEKFNRFYKDKNFEIGDSSADKDIKLYGNPYNFSYYMLHKDKYELMPTEDTGIYDIREGYTDFDNDCKTDWKAPSLDGTLKLAKLLDSVNQDIDFAENKYGMDCVNILDKADDIKEQAYREDIIKEIKSSYTVKEELLKKIATHHLEALLNNKEDLDSLKHYGIALQEDDWSSPYLVDKFGYINEQFGSFYANKGYGIVRQKFGNGYIIWPKENEDTSYTLNDKGKGRYNVYANFYEGGSHLSHIADSHLKDLLKFAKILDDVANSIDSAFKF